MLENFNLLGNQWNIVAFLGQILLIVFTFRKLRYLGKKVAALYSLVFSATFIAFIDLATLPLFAYLWNFNILSLIQLKFQQTLTLIAGGTFILVTPAIRNLLKFHNNVTLVGLSWQYFINMPVVGALGNPDYRNLIYPYNLYAYYFLYIPSYVFWLLAYWGIWKRGKQLQGLSTITPTLGKKSAMPSNG